MGILGNVSAILFPYSDRTNFVLLSNCLKVRLEGGGVVAYASVAK